LVQIKFSSKKAYQLKSYLTFLTSEVKIGAVLEADKLSFTTVKKILMV